MSGRPGDSSHGGIGVGLGFPGIRSSHGNRRSEGGEGSGKEGGSALPPLAGGAGGNSTASLSGLSASVMRRQSGADNGDAGRRRISLASQSTNGSEKREGRRNSVVGNSPLVFRARPADVGLVVGCCGDVPSIRLFHVALQFASSTDHVDVVHVLSKTSTALAQLGAKRLQERLHVRYASEMAMALPPKLRVTVVPTAKQPVDTLDEVAKATLGGGAYCVIVGRRPATPRLSVMSSPAGSPNRRLSGNGTGSDLGRAAETQEALPAPSPERAVDEDIEIPWGATDAS